jgi:hypothetical protein
MYTYTYKNTGSKMKLEMSKLYRQTKLLNMVRSIQRDGELSIPFQEKVEIFFSKRKSWTRRQQNH